MINVRPILEWCKSINYVLLRDNSDLENIERGHDIDILTDNVPAIMNLIICGLKDYVFSGYTIRKTGHGGHTHIDLLDKDGLVVRFDIVDRFVFDLNAIPPFILTNKKDVNGIYYPDEVGDVTTRIIEYLSNNKKTKHLDYVRTNLLQQK